MVQAQAAIIEWARTHPDREVSITWAGDGEERAALERAPAPPSLRQVFLGHVNYDELARAYADSGVLLPPTLYDEWGLVVNEAMASGLPVVGSVNSQAVEELVVEGETGWSFDPARRETLLAALDRVFATPPRALARMRHRARERAFAITVEGAVDRLMAVV